MALNAATKINILLPRQSQTGSHQDGGSNSASGLVSTLVPTFLIALIAVTLFLLLQRKLSRIYHARTMKTVIPSADVAPEPASGLFGWVRNFRALPDTYVLQHQSLDGYLWLRYLKMLAIISFVGCCCTWPVLFPVNATGGGGQSQLDVLSFSNVANVNRFYAHALIAWIFQGFVLYYTTRERIFFIGLRQAYFLSSFHAQRLSSRVVLFLTVPESQLAESSLRHTLGSDVTRIWMVPDSEKLEDLVEERNKAATKLEGAQMKMIKKANKNRLKESTGDSENAGAQKWLDSVSRPTTRTKFLIGKKVDAIDHFRDIITSTDPQIKSLQESFLERKNKFKPAAFVEFSSQAAAQHAYQLFAKEKMTTMHPRYIGVLPDEVVWKNLRVSYSARKTKMILATIVIVLMIIFWAIPVAVVGCISNINYLTNRVPFLGFINNIPSVILGVVTGLLPVVLLAVLMALVPIFCRFLAKFAGEPTLSAIELRTQTWYFAFQVIQVFLITTFTSAASSVVTQIIANPGIAITLLSTNLPKASNFYISYFILYGLTTSAMQLLNISPLIMIMVLGKFLDSTPRKMYNRWIGLVGLGWGSIYPVYTNIGVIALTYSIIAPLVLGFATIGFTLLYIGYRYNFLFTLGVKVDTKGESYNRALKQLLTGLYLSTLCLIGLFAIDTSNSAAAAGPLVLMIIFLVFMIVYQVLLDLALGPMEQGLPTDLMAENDPSMLLSARAEEGKAVDLRESSDGAQETVDKTKEGSSDAPRSRWEPKPETVEAREQKQPNFLSRRLKPLVFKSYEANKRLLGDSATAEKMPHYSAEGLEEAYECPEMQSVPPLIWLAKDGGGISEIMVKENKEKGIETTDSEAWFDQKNKLDWNHEHPELAPIYEPIMRY